MTSSADDVGGHRTGTNNFDLNVDGLVQLTGANTNLIIGGAGSELNADDVTINSGAESNSRAARSSSTREAGRRTVRHQCRRQTHWARHVEPDRWVVGGRRYSSTTAHCRGCAIRQ